MYNYDFGWKSNIKLTLSEEDASNYNEYVTSEEGSDIRTNAKKYASYIIVTTLIGKKSFELTAQGIEPSKGDQVILTRSPDGEDSSEGISGEATSEEPGVINEDYPPIQEVQNPQSNGPSAEMIFHKSSSDVEELEGEDISVFVNEETNKEQEDDLV